jgi:hypothetical protein
MSDTDLLAWSNAFSQILSAKSQKIEPLFKVTVGAGRTATRAVVSASF